MVPLLILTTFSSSVIAWSVLALAISAICFSVVVSPAMAAPGRNIAIKNRNTNFVLMNLILTEDDTTRKDVRIQRKEIFMAHEGKKNEDEWFAKHEKDLLRNIRIDRERRQKELDDRMKQEEARTQKELHWMKC